MCDRYYLILCIMLTLQRNAVQTNQAVSLSKVEFEINTNCMQHCAFDNYIRIGDSGSDGSAGVVVESERGCE